MLRLDLDGWSPAGAAADDYAQRRLTDLAEFSASLRLPMISTALVISALAWLGGAHWPVVVLWLITCLVVRELQILALMRLARSTRPVAQRMRQSAFNKLPLGLVHGASSFFMLTTSLEYDALLTMILMSLSAGAVSTTFMVPRGFIAYAAAVSLPNAVLWLLSGTWLGAGIGLLVLMFFGVQLRFARQNLSMYETSYQMRLENTELLQKLSEERKRLAQARDAAVEADLSKSRFLASASHDLRQPLQSLSLNSGALSRLALEGEARAIGDEIDSGINALRQMLDALLDVSKLDAGAVVSTFQQVPLDRLLSGVAARFQSAAKAKGLRLECRCAADLIVTSDANLLARIVSNLLDNAVKFTTTGSISVSAEPSPEGVRVTIEDSGPGIDPANRDRVFEDLVQLVNPQRSRSLGFGLGLGIVRRLAHLLSIRYDIESTPGEGTRFHLWLPSGVGDVPVIAEAPSTPPGLIARRVLVLDDDPSVRTAYRNALESQRCEVRCAATLGEALDELAALKPEIALVDFRLADQVNGLEAIQRLRRDSPGLAAIVVSADTSAQMRDEAARMSVPVLRKPINDAALAAAMNEALRDAQARLIPSAAPVTTVGHGH